MIKDINELIQIYPFGVSVGHELTNPIMIFKSKDGDSVLPVMVNSLEAGVTLAQSNKGIVPLSPHKATQQIFEVLGIKIEKCVFTEVKQNSQYLKIFFNQNGQKNSVSVKANDVLSLCLHLEAPIFTTHEVIVKSKVLVAEVEELKKQFSLKGNSIQRNHPYIN